MKLTVAFGARSLSASVRRHSTPQAPRLAIIQVGSRKGGTE